MKIFFWFFFFKFLTNFFPIPLNLRLLKVRTFSTKKCFFLNFAPLLNYYYLLCGSFRRFETVCRNKIFYKLCWIHFWSRLCNCRDKSNRMLLSFEFQRTLTASRPPRLEVLQGKGVIAFPSPLFWRPWLLDRILFWKHYFCCSNTIHLQQGCPNFFLGGPDW